MIVTDLARTYPMATGRELRRAIVERGPYFRQGQGDGEERDDRDTGDR